MYVRKNDGRGVGWSVLSIGHTLEAGFRWNPSGKLINSDEPCLQNNHKSIQLFIQRQFVRFMPVSYELAIIFCSVACSYWVMDARGKLGDCKESERVARGALL